MKSLQFYIYLSICTASAPVGQHLGIWEVGGVVKKLIWEYSLEKWESETLFVLPTLPAPCLKSSSMQISWVMFHVWVFPFLYVVDFMVLHLESFRSKSFCFEELFSNNYLCHSAGLEYFLYLTLESFLFLVICCISHLVIFKISAIYSQICRYVLLFFCDCNYISEGNL